MIDSLGEMEAVKETGYEVCKEIFAYEMGLDMNDDNASIHDNGFPKRKELNKRKRVKVLTMSPVSSIRLVAILYLADNLSEVSRITNQASIWKEIWMLKKHFRSYKVLFRGLPFFMGVHRIFFDF